MTDVTAYAGPPRVLSGVQPSGALHLGNYLGALKKFVDLQDKMDCFIFVADLHAITNWQDPALLTAQTREIAAAYIASGLDPKRATIFPQSAVTAHLELARDIAAKFNHDFDAPNFFPLIEPLIEGPGARVMSLRDGKVKMSKSDPSDYSRINLLDDADAIVQKVRKAKTDAEPLPEHVDGLEGRPEADNLVGVYGALAGQTKAQVLEQFGGQGFGQAFKPALADLAAQVVGPIGTEMRRLLTDPAELDRILADGALRARAVAEPTVAETKKLVGFWPG